MLNARHRLFWTVVNLLGICFFLLGCATKEGTVQPQGTGQGLDLEFVGGRIELRNPMPRNGEEVEATVIVRNRGDQEVKRVPVFFYDNLRVFSTEEIDLEPGGQRRLIVRWKASSGNHTVSAVIDPSHHFAEMRRERTEVSANVLVR